MAGAAGIDAGSRGKRLGRLLRFGAVAVLVSVAACGPAPPPAQTTPDADGWREFSGTWTAAGTRRTVSLGGERRASIVDLRGALLLAGPSRPGIGFRGDAIGLSDSATGFVGRAVWTDENGDQVYSELRGEGTASGNALAGTFLGGTGRYAGATGTYEFGWQYVLETEDGTVQGRATNLKGRVRFGSPPSAPATAGGAK